MRDEKSSRNVLNGTLSEFSKSQAQNWPNEEVLCTYSCRRGVSLRIVTSAAHCARLPPVPYRKHQAPRPHGWGVLIWDLNRVKS